MRGDTREVEKREGRRQRTEAWGEAEGERAADGRGKGAGRAERPRRGGLLQPKGPGGVRVTSFVRSFIFLLCDLPEILIVKV